MHNRNLSWELLAELATQSTIPWVCLGDFNEILFPTEKNGGSDRAEWQMTNFRNVVDACGFRDVPFSGYAFTYDNSRMATIISNFVSIGHWRPYLGLICFRPRTWFTSIGNGRTTLPSTLFYGGKGNGGSLVIDLSVSNICGWRMMNVKGL